MNSIRVPAFLLGLGLALGAIAGGARAQQYDPYNDSRDSGRGDQDRYDEDRYDDYDRDHFEDRNGRRVIRCESQDRRTQYCDIDTRGGVRLLRRLSDARCVRGDTWGVNNRGIWVTNGCRGEFEVGIGGYGHVFRCESTDNRTRYCNADTRYGIRIVRQLSRSRCVQGQTWDISRNGVWVSRGCRAEFSDRYYRERDRY